MSRYSPDREEWANFDEWLADTTEMVRRPGEDGQGPSAEAIKDHIAEADEVWAQYDEKKRDLRTIKPDHGRDR